MGRTCAISHLAPRVNVACKLHGINIGVILTRDFVTGGLARIGDLGIAINVGAICRSRSISSVGVG